MKRTVFALLAAIVAGLALPLLETSAQIPGTGTLRLGVSQCPDGYTGENYAVDCAVPAAGIEFFLGTPNTDNVASGVSSDFEPVTFDLGQFDLNPDAPDTVWLGEWVTQTGDYAATCAANGEPLAISYERIPFNDSSLFGIAFDFTSGDDIVCNWYRIDASIAEDPDGGVVQLPATGSGSAAHAGWWR